MKEPISPITPNQGSRPNSKMIKSQINQQTPFVQDDQKSINFQIENNSSKGDVSFTYSYSVMSKQRYSMDPDSRLNRKYPDVLTLENIKGANDEAQTKEKIVVEIDLDEKIAYLRSYLQRKKKENRVSNILYMEDSRFRDIDDTESADKIVVLAHINS